MFEYSPKNPCRTVHWVWDRAKNIRSGGPAFHRKLDGKWVAAAVKLQTALDQSRSMQDRYLASLAQGGPFFAQCLWDKEQHPQRWELEARILAGQPDDEIAQRLGTDADVIEAYEAIFFNVRPKLNNRGYVLHQAIGPAVARGLKDREVDAMWKLMGYLGGARVLDHLIGFVGNCPHPTNDAGVLDFFHRDHRQVLQMRSAVLARTAQINFMAPFELMDRYHKLLEMEQNAGNAGQSQASIMQNLEALFDVVGSKFRIAEAADSDPKTSGVGMSAKERIEFTTENKVPAGVQEDLQSLMPALSRFRNDHVARN